MDRDNGLYLDLWTKFESLLLKMMEMAIENSVSYPLKQSDFKAVGNRAISGYGFNLEIKRGRVINNISGNAVARDLFSVLNNSLAIKQLMKENNYKINLNKNFVLSVATFYCLLSDLQ